MPGGVGQAADPSGSVPATQAAVASDSAEAQPEVTRAAWQPSSSAIRLPTASCRSSMRHVLPRGDLHRRHDFGPHQRAGQGRERAGRVDERPDAQLLDHVASRARLPGRRPGRPERGVAGRARRPGQSGTFDAWSGADSSSASEGDVWEDHHSDDGPGQSTRCVNAGSPV